MKQMNQPVEGVADQDRPAAMAAGVSRRMRRVLERQAVSLSDAVSRFVEEMEAPLDSLRVDLHLVRDFRGVGAEEDVRVMLTLEYWEGGQMSRTFHWELDDLLTGRKLVKKPKDRGKRTEGASTESCGDVEHAACPPHETEENERDMASQEAAHGLEECGGSESGGCDVLRGDLDSENQLSAAEQRCAAGVGAGLQESRVSDAPAGKPVEVERGVEAISRVPSVEEPWLDADVGTGSRQGAEKEIGMCEGWTKTAVDRQGAVLWFVLRFLLAQWVWLAVGLAAGAAAALVWRGVGSGGLKPVVPGQTGSARAGESQLSCCGERANAWTMLSPLPGWMFCFRGNRRCRPPGLNRRLMALIPPGFGCGRAKLDRAGFQLWL